MRAKRTGPPFAYLQEGRSGCRCYHRRCDAHVRGGTSWQEDLLGSRLFVHLARSSDAMARGAAFVSLSVPSR